jgi:endonuclease YncB( thermonuclease family)
MSERIRLQLRVRLLDIDAPELGQAFGRRSRDSLASMCAGATARVNEQGRDRYGRTLGHVMCGTYDANTERVRRGMAWVFVRYGAKNSPLYAIQNDARIEAFGRMLIQPHRGNGVGSNDSREQVRCSASCDRALTTISIMA